MKKPILLAGLLLGLIARAAHADIELKNDGFGGGGMAGFQQGFVANEIGASRFTPPTPGIQVIKVRFLYGGMSDGVMRMITLHIYDDSALTDDPGTELYMGDFMVTASDSAMQEIDITSDMVMVPGTFRVGIEFHDAGSPSIARDTDGTIAADKNFILAQGIGWIRSQAAGLTGDWIIRAVVPGGTTPDAGPGAPDASPGAPDAGAGGPDAGSGGGCQSNSQCMTGEYCGPSHVCTFDCRVNSDCSGGDTCNSLGMCVAPGGNGKSGCGCNASSRRGAAGAGAGVMLFGLMLAARRRRRRSA